MRCVPLIDEHGDNGSTVEDSTISGNSAAIAGDGGRIYLELPGLPSPGFQLALAADIVAEQSGGDCAVVGFEARISDAGYNVDDDGTCGLHSANDSVLSSTVIDNYLGTLGSNGGPTQTVPLLATPSPFTGSSDPAYGVIPSTFDMPVAVNGQSLACSVPDQRGVTRKSTCDMGAFELITSPPSQTPEVPSVLLLPVSAALTLGVALAFARLRRIRRIAPAK